CSSRRNCLFGNDAEGALPSESFAEDINFEAKRSTKMSIDQEITVNRVPRFESRQ
ncbi:3591_t:CDS:1, partial [Rhizophagus irregularis]